MRLQNNGNLVVDDEDGSRLWESRTTDKCDDISGAYVYIIYFVTPWETNNFNKNIAQHLKN